MARRDYAGAAARARLNADISATSTTITLDGASGWPVGANGEFFVAIDRGNAGEEKILVASRSGNTLTLASVAKRGQGGTSAATHTAGVYVEHVHTETDDDEANAHVNNAAGATPHTTAMIADDAVTLAKIQNLTTDRLLGRDTAGTGDAEQLTVGGGLAFSGSGGIILAQMPTLTLKGNNTGGTAAPADLTVAQVMAMLSLDSTDLSDFIEAVQDTVGAFSGFGGSGLTFTYDDAGNALTLVVNVDGTTLEINADTLRLKDGGVTTAAKLTDGIVTAAKIANEVWDTYTPAITADSGSPIIGNGILSGRYRKQGRTVLVEVSLQLGTTTNFGGGNVYLSLPFTMRTPSPTRQCIGVADLYDSSASTAFAGTVIPVSTWAKVLFYASGSVNPVSGAGSVPFAWATGDVLSFSARFETAS